MKRHPSKAHEIGKRLAEELLHGQYEYVLSTHIDREHLHNHIIINAVNFETGKSFSTELDRPDNPVWKRIRKISDTLCKEYGLSVIQAPERGKGKSHYEWEQNNAGNSWKAKLKISIDECVKTATGFDDFLEKMKHLDYEIKQGKYISFRAKGQERFTRAKTLGYYYTDEQLRYRIERRIMCREKQQFTSAEIHTPRGERFIAIEGKIIESEGLKRWSMLQNMKKGSKLINELAEQGFETPEQLREKQIDLYDKKLDIQDEIQNTEAQITVTTHNLQQLLTYLDTKEINQQYHKSKNKDKFFRKHERELHLYQIAKKNVQKLLNENGKLPAANHMEKHLQALENKKSELMERYKKTNAEIKTVEKLKMSIDNLEKTDRTKENNLNK